MQGSYKVVQNSDNSDFYGLRDATVHFKSTLKVPGGLKDFAFYSAYIQLGAPESDPMSLLEDQFYEGFVCTVRYSPTDGGKVNEANAFRDTTCGTTELSSLNTSWRGMRSYLDGTDKCVADYILDFEQSSTSNLALTSGEVKGVVECAFKRDFLVPNLFAIRTD